MLTLGSLQSSKNEVKMKALTNLGYNSLDLKSAKFNANVQLNFRFTLKCLC